MGDVTTLLREAVPVEDIEPDIAAVTRRVRARRRRRTVVRAAASLVVVLAFGAIAAAGLAQRGIDPTVEAGEVAQERASASSAGASGQSPDADRVDATEFTKWLATRSWLATVPVPAWPVQPADFVGAGIGSAGTETEAVVLGTLTEVHAGTGERPICMYVRYCLSRTQAETVVQVDRALVGDVPASGDLAVLWGLDVESNSDEGLAPEADEFGILAFEEAAPVGARVLVFLHKDEAGRWMPIEPSGIVVEDPDGVAVPQQDPAAPDLAMSFDDYVAEVERLLAGGG